MVWRFYKRIRILPFVRINFSKRGFSVTVGRRGLTFSIGRRGITRTISIPNTGVSFSKNSRSNERYKELFTYPWVSSDRSSKETSKDLVEREFDVLEEEIKIGASGK